MRQPYLLGLDIGTSSCKAIAFTLDGRRLLTGRGSYHSFVDEYGGVRQRPSDWWSAALDALGNAVIADGTCVGIGLSGQIGTYVPVDASFKPIDDAWTWQDGRPASVLDLLRATIDLEAIAEDLRTWLPLGASWPLPRLLWLREVYPDLLASLRYLAMPKDFIVHQLTGTALTDASSWRGLVRRDGTVHSGALETLDVPDVVPPRRSPTEQVGELLPAVAFQLGLSREVPIFLGSNDFACALMGAGVVEEGDSFDIGGTSEHIGTLSVERSRGTGLVVVPYPPAAIADSYVSYGVTSNAGSVIEWLESTLLADLEPADRTRRLFELAELSGHNQRPLSFIPHLNGARSPLWDTTASGAWVGLRSEHTRADLIRAALEGVALNLRNVRAASRLSVPGQLLRSAGGTARSGLWNQIKASAMATPVAVMAEPEAASVGAAIFASLGAGIHSSPSEAIRAMTRISYVLDPRPEQYAYYDDAFGRYRVLGDAIRGATAANDGRTTHSA